MQTHKTANKEKKQQKKRPRIICARREYEQIRKNFAQTAPVHHLRTYISYARIMYHIRFDAVPYYYYYRYIFVLQTRTVRLREEKSLI